MAGHPALAIVTVYKRLPVQPAASVAVMVNVNVPAVVGVPVIAPEPPLRTSPVGSAPLEMVNVYGAVPPEPETVWLYAVPTLPFGSVAGLTVMMGHASTPHVLTLFVSSVTAPLRANALPLVFAPVVSVMLVRARMSPTNDVPVPSVAELPTCQYTLLQLLPPLLITVTEELLAVVSVLPILKRNSAFGLPRASRVSAPVSCADDE